jgi:hypothetical protein
MMVMVMMVMPTEARIMSVAVCRGLSRSRARVIWGGVLKGQFL